LEGQITDGNLECLYHGWQFNGAGACIKIPQLAPGAKIPKAACTHSYEVRESQGVIWVWLSEKTKGDPKKLPWFEHYAREGFQDISSIHELPYDYSILLENLLDPAHIPISHDQADPSAKRENSQALVSSKSLQLIIECDKQELVILGNCRIHLGVVIRPIMLVCNWQEVWMMKMQIVQCFTSEVGLGFNGKFLELICLSGH